MRAIYSPPESPIHPVTIPTICISPPANSKSNDVLGKYLTTRILCYSVLIFFFASYYIDVVLNKLNFADNCYYFQLIVFHPILFYQVKLHSLLDFCLGQKSSLIINWCLPFLWQFFYSVYIWRFFTRSKFQCCFVHMVVWCHSLTSHLVIILQGSIRNPI